MNKFLDSHDQPKLHQEDKHYLNRLTARNDIEAVIVSQQRKSQDWVDALLNRSSKKN
jgi:hypothetical protein